MKNGIVQPVVTPETPRLGPQGVMAATRADLSCLITALNLKDSKASSLFMSQLFIRDDGIFLSGPFMGAPYAVMILETLAAWGAREILFLGWCGAISPRVQIGDMLIAEMAWIDEGTSGGYCPDVTRISRPSACLTDRVKSMMMQAGLSFHEGAIWTTDAIFRETPEKVRHFQAEGALAVEMELSALYTVGAFLNIDVSSILVVSDDLSDLTWKPGFKDPRFLDARRKILPILSEFCIRN